MVSVITTEAKKLKWGNKGYPNYSSSSTYSKISIFSPVKGTSSNNGGCGAGRNCGYSK